MDLHRVEGTSDWRSVPIGKRNIWQKVAASSLGIITPGNIVSVLGLASIPYGLWLMSDGKVWQGFAIIIIGRLCDLLDGWLADKTGTKSPLGEKIDATFDKISLIAILIGLLGLDILPGYALILLVLPHAIIALLALSAFLQGKTLHPSRLGKNSMALGWVVIGAYIFISQFNGLVDTVGHLLVLSILALSTLLGFIAAVGYVREAS